MGYVEVDARKCKGCELCVAACPRGLLRLSTGINDLGYHPVQFNDVNAAEDRQLGCTGCTLCGLICPDTAITVYR